MYEFRERGDEIHIMPLTFKEYCEGLNILDYEKALGATSALDNETSSAITNNLLEIDNTMKVMIIHRLDEDILNKFDEIIVMKNGQIVEYGTYNDLMNNNATFKSLVELG